jgi:hypothetical protein
MQRTRNIVGYENSALYDIEVIVGFKKIKAEGRNRNGITSKGL